MVRCIVANERGHVLARRRGRGWRLLTVERRGWTPADAVGRLLGRPAVLLKPLGPDLAALACSDPNLERTDLAWRPVGDLETGERQEATTWLSELADPAGIQPEWFRPGWLREATAWADDVLAALGWRRAGPPFQVRHWSLSAVVRLPTDRGDVYLKSVLPAFAIEPAVTRAVAAWADGPPLDVLAHDPGRGRWLSADHAGVCGEDVDGGSPPAGARALARLQVRAASRHDLLLATGCEQLDAAAVAASIDPLLLREDLWAVRHERALAGDELDRLRACRPWLSDLCERLAVSPIPLSLTHGDFHPGNVALTARGWLVHDWSFAAISHPFFDLANWLHDVPPDSEPAHVAAYLEPWAATHGMSAARAAWSSAKPLGAYYALTRLAAVLDATPADQWFSWLPMLFGWARRLYRVHADPDFRYGLPRSGRR
ncbi:MAG TPA: phosphotransferase [Candidatus Dormibacteraeota bacterium]|nr:phosphotransferase [Candidatus Dormibacteraeota bacterium]